MVKQIPGGTAKKKYLIYQIKVVAKNGFRYFAPQVKAFLMT